MRRPIQTSAELVEALPAYMLSDDVEAVAREVIAANSSFRVTEDIRVGYAWRTDRGIEDGDEIDTIVRAQRAPALWAALGDYDVVVWVKQAYWKAWGIVEQRAAITHALCHIFVSEEGKVKILGHDVAEFTRVAAQFGPWTTALARFQRGLASNAEPKAEQTTMTVEANGRKVKIDAEKVVDLRNAARRARESKPTDVPPASVP